MDAIGGLPDRLEDLMGPEFWDDGVVSAPRSFAGVGETDAILAELAGRLADTREQTIIHDGPALEEVFTDSPPVENVPGSTGPRSPRIRAVAHQATVSRRGNGAPRNARTWQLEGGSRRVPPRPAPVVRARSR
jgi:hypothetical protein